MKINKKNINVEFFDFDGNQIGHHQIEIKNDRMYYFEAKDNNFFCFNRHNERIAFFRFSLENFKGSSFNINLDAKIININSFLSLIDYDYSSTVFNYELSTEVPSFIIKSGRKIKNFINEIL